LNVNVVLALIAGTTSQSKIGNPVGASLGFRLDMLDLERDIFRITIGALAAPLFEEVLPHFVASEFTLLIFDSINIWIEKEMSIEAYSFGTNGRNRDPRAKPFDPRADSINSMEQRRRKPPYRLGTIEESWRAVASLAVAPTPAKRPSLSEGITNG
jgi:hypothetical protein